MDTTPKPLQAAHFYTESVGAGEDGPTFLYLDTVNTANNFWGSSIISTHQDAKKSAAANGNVTVKAPVTGLTLSTLLKRSVIRAKGSHVIIKIDIEGGEYVVINEAIDTLCDFTSAGVLVHLMMETHSPRVTGGYNADMRKYQAETSKRIPQCNISTGALAGGDH
jgi:transketolase